MGRKPAREEKKTPSMFSDSATKTKRKHSELIIYPSSQSSCIRVLKVNEQKAFKSNQKVLQQNTIESAAL